MALTNNPASMSAPVLGVHLRIHYRFTKGFTREPFGWSASANVRSNLFTSLYSYVARTATNIPRGGGTRPRLVAAVARHSKVTQHGSEPGGSVTPLVNFKIVTRNLTLRVWELARSILPWERFGCLETISNYFHENYFHILHKIFMLQKWAVCAIYELGPRITNTLEAFLLPITPGLSVPGSRTAGDFFKKTCGLELTSSIVLPATDEKSLLQYGLLRL
ncbi:hypothetical protein EVAR_32821_1 [Eumeta japonica]|uniref:Uncharacterized protein n=1 Tax=Eumeta variegata TaxID=151549 RepID=A0A4C1WBZ9_EUMVA|nr:hypothetical protein EVAR_32821_1 [Eumeta japonica]